MRRHNFWADAMAMDNCAKCGHVATDSIHRISNLDRDIYALIDLAEALGVAGRPRGDMGLTVKDDETELWYGVGDIVRAVYSRLFPRPAEPESKITTQKVNVVADTELPDAPF